MTGRFDYPFFMTHITKLYISHAHNHKVTTDLINDTTVINEYRTYS